MHACMHGLSEFVVVVVYMHAIHVSHVVDGLNLAL